MPYLVIIREEKQIATDAQGADSNRCKEPQQDIMWRQYKLKISIRSPIF